MSKRYDANSGVVSDALRVLYRRKAELFRPARFRSIVSVTDGGGLPDYVQSLDVEETFDFAEFRPAGQFDNSKPLGTEEISTTSYRTLKMQSAFKLIDDELAAYASQGINPGSRRVAALQTRAEQIMNSIAATGYSGARIKGLLNQAADASPTAAQIKLASSTLDSFVDGEDAETVAGLLDDMVASLNVNSLEVFDAAKIVLPVVEYNYAAKVRSAIDNRTALEIFKSASPDVLVQKWNKCDGIGTNSNGRAVVMAAGADVAEMVNIYELREQKRIEVHDGVEVGMAFKTAGVIVNEPRGLEYWDFEA